MRVLVTVGTRFAVTGERRAVSATAAARPPARPLACWRENACERMYERKGPGVEVKIGITDSPRELVFNSAQTPAEVEKLVTAALGKDSGVLA